MTPPGIQCHGRWGEGDFLLKKQLFSVSTISMLIFLLFWKHLACQKPLTYLRKEQAVDLLCETTCVQASGRSSYIFISGVRTAQQGCQVARWWQILLCYLVLTHVMRILSNHNSEEHGEGGCASLLCLVHWTGWEFTFGCSKRFSENGTRCALFCWGGGVGWIMEWWWE